MSTTSVLPKVWVTGPWPLLSSPQGEGKDTKPHYSVHLGTEMCHVHNIFIRSMNSIYLQSPHVSSPADIADLLFYAKSLCEAIHMHHESEENYFFPDLAAYTSNKNIMAVNAAQHHAFHAALDAFNDYCAKTTPAEYSHPTFKAKIDAFAPALFQHLGDEITTILALSDIPSADLKKMWEKCVKHAQDGASFNVVFPLAFGCLDAGFEGGKMQLIQLPTFVRWGIIYWFSRKHQSAWRFNPSDGWGIPRELAFLPKGAEAEAK